MGDNGMFLRALRNGWAVTKVALLFILAGVTAYTVWVFGHDDFPLGETMLCMATWVAVPSVWLLDWAGRKLFLPPPEEPRGFDVVTRADLVLPVASDTETTERGEDRGG